MRDQLLRLTRAEVYSLDISALAQWTQKLQKQAAQDIQIHGATITMHVQAEAGQRLLTTVPYDKGWHAEIDGQPAAITPFQNTFIELPLSEGTHEIKLVFRPRGLTLGPVSYTHLDVYKRQKEVIANRYSGDRVYTLKENPEMITRILNAAWNKMYRRSLFKDNGITYPVSYTHPE